MKPAVLRTLTPLTRARRDRTHAWTCVQRGIHSMLTDEAKWAITGEIVGPDYKSLPSWWPFWSDVLVSNVRELVRAARTLAKLEGVEL